MSEPTGMERPEARLLATMMQPLPDTHPFQVFIGGKEANPGSGVMITSPWGSWALGKRPEGYPGVLYREPQGGGAATLPWTRMPEGPVLVALLRADRPNMGGYVWELMGGMVSRPADTKTDVQAREASEEGGLDTRQAQPLPGGPVLQDRLVYVANIGENEGVHLFHYEVPFTDIYMDEEGYRRPKQPLTKKWESILAFMSIDEAARSPDPLVHSAVLRLSIMLKSL